VRLASKSVRCRALMERAALQGVLAFTLPEALWLADQGWKDLVVAYPSTDRSALARASGHDQVTVMIDGTEQLNILAQSTRVCLDVDAGWWLLGGRVKIGAKRSPVHSPEQAAALAREVVARGHVLDGIMSYEGHIAGLGDRRAAIHLMQALSARELAARRAAVVAAVSEVAPLRFVNGGGTGSIERTVAEPAVTEVAAGSGLYSPTLFDGYRAFRARPAAFFALPVVRRPSARVATVLGGGYPASGPAGKDRLPKPVFPPGLRLDAQEGAGEVQTPLHGAGERLKIGDRVWFRHAKAGELCERFATLHLIRGDQVVDEVPTYRGEGCTFL
jgi:D-serine deaminase-like pyridoxal phosphate-dependent protein